MSTLSLKERFFEIVNNHHNFRDFKSEFEQWASDEEAVSYTVGKFGIAIQYASYPLRNNKDIALKAVTRSGFAFSYLSQNLQNDKELALIAVKHDGILLEHASETLKNDKEVVSIAVQSTPFSFDCASAELRDDKDFVLELVSQNSQNPPNLLFLMHISDNLQNDNDILQVIRNNPDTFLNQDFSNSEKIKEWFYHKIKVLEIMEDEQIMQQDIIASNFRAKPRKF